MRIADVADVADVGDAVQIDAELPLSGVTIELKHVSIADARRRWADLLRRMYEVDPLQCRPAAVSEVRRRDAD